MLFQVTMFPSGRTTESVSADVAKVINMIDRSGLPYKLTPMATVIEGNWEEVMDLLNRARKMLRRKHSRIYISIVIDDRKGAKKSIESKVKSIEKRLGRKVEK